MSSLTNILKLINKINNANSINHTKVFIPNSKMNLEIIKILEEENIISKYTQNNQLNLIEINLPLIRKNYKLIGISKPSKRVYIPNNLKLIKIYTNNSLGIISTNLGILTTTKAHALNVGGELLFFIKF